MIHNFFDQVDIPQGKALLVHARLRGLHNRTGRSYPELADDLLQCLLACNPSLLLVPAFTIYSYMAIRIFHLKFAHSEVGRFSEELRRKGYPRTPDPMYSMLDILDALPKGLNYLQTFGPGTLFDYLLQQDSIVINVDMEGFYATPVHCVELAHQVPYRYEMTFDGHLQCDHEPWQKVSYKTYVRALKRDGTGPFPPYNQKRRNDYLREKGVITESSNEAGHLAWAPLTSFYSAMDSALSKDKSFLVDQEAV